MSRLLVLLLAGIVLQPLVALGVVVSSTAPGQNALNIPANVSIVVTFDESIEPLSVDSAAVIVGGNMSGLHPGSVAGGLEIYRRRIKDVSNSRLCDDVRRS